MPPATVRTSATSNRKPGFSLPSSHPSRADQIGMDDTTIAADTASTRACAEMNRSADTPNTSEASMNRLSPSNCRAAGNCPASAVKTSTVSPASISRTGANASASQCFSTDTASGKLAAHNSMQTMPAALPTRGLRSGAFMTWLLPVTVDPARAYMPNCMPEQPKSACDPCLKCKPGAPVYGGNARLQVHRARPARWSAGGPEVPP
jgi:hypothetical protein